VVAVRARVNVNVNSLMVSGALPKQRAGFVENHA
jgi:hypothetical protein